MTIRLGFLLMLALMLSGVAASAAPVEDGAGPVTKSGKTTTKQVCPKTPDAQVMRCHALVVTDSKGKPIETPQPPSPPLPNGKHPDR